MNNEVLQNAVSSGDFPGVVGGVVQGNGATYTSAFGKQSVVQDQAMREDTIFRIASMIKPVIAVAAMQQYEKGLFDLDEPASHFLPQIAALRVLDGFANDGQPILRPPQSSITIRQLFTQTSGMAYEILNDDLLRYVTHFVSDSQSVARDYHRLPLIDDPGRRWHYGYGTSWLAELIEVLSGQDLKTYFENNLFEPLGMVDTYYSAATHATVFRTQGHRVT